MTNYSNRLAQLLEMAEEIESFRLCGPSDDPDEQTAVTYAFKHIAKRFVGLAKRIRNPELQEELNSLNLNLESIYDVYDLRADIQLVIDQLRDLTEQPIEWSSSSTEFVDSSLVEQLRELRHPQYDLSKIVRFCEELNNSYKTANYLAAILLIRALINHVPPIFGHTTFQQVVSQASRSRRDLFAPLENIARDIADLHTHAYVRQREVLPTKNQIEPFKANLEVLLQEIIVETVRANTSP